MGWQFPWVSSHGSDSNYDFGFAFTNEQMTADEFRKLIEDPPDWLEEPYYHQLLDQTPKGRVDEFRVFRHDEYEGGPRTP